jgi:ketosteroid isomerase-like protein
MSQENVDAFSRGAAAFNRGDIDAWLAGMDTEVESYSALPNLLRASGGVHRGHEGVRDMVRNLSDSFHELTVEYSEIRDLGDRILAIGQLHTRGNLSGAVSDTPYALVSEYRGAKMTRVRTYLDVQEAVEAASLSE